MSGKVTASAVIDAALKRIEASEPTINAFTDVVAERAAQARRRDRCAALRSRAAGGRAVRGQEPVRHRGPADARRLEDQPRRARRRRDGALVRKLEAAGAILVGGLNMGEYAYDFTGENAHYGPSRNPRDPRA